MIEIELLIAMMKLVTLGFLLCSLLMLAIAVPWIFLGCFVNGILCIYQKIKEWIGR
jgi:hypothetical protein